jgi:arabinose-5-phosphate isomerase
MPPPPDTLAATQESLLNAAREVVRSEAASVAAVAEQLDERTAAAIRLIYERTGGVTAAGDGRAAEGMLVISGLGKSGLVGQRISASFASTGTPSHFLHPVEALHGDLGRVRRHDTALLLSYSGETDEVVRLLDLLKRQQVPTLAITSTRGSTLGRLADITIELGRIEEVCPHGLAPTTTVNCISAVGDALVLGVMSLRRFSREDYAMFHPGGSLGRKLLKVHEVMEFKVGENFGTAPETRTLREILAMDAPPPTPPSAGSAPPSGRRAGAVVITDGAGKLAGVFTDGDLRRLLRGTPPPALLDAAIGAVMTRTPKHIHKDALASEALALLNQYRIDELPVVDDGGRPIGLIDVQDLVRLRIVE